MQHKWVAVTAFEGINDLCIAFSTESCDNQGLCLATCKQSGTVCTWQNACAYSNWSNSSSITTIDTWLAIENTATDDFFLQSLYRTGNLFRIVR